MDEKFKKEFVITFAKHASENMTDDLVAKQLMIRGELLKRDFTKRQLNIIWFIFTYSIVMGKEKAVFNHLQDFELCGVDKTKIRSELDKLTEMNVIEINENLNLYCIKDIEHWTTTFHSGYNETRSRDIVLLNLRDAGINIEEMLRGILLK